MSDNNGLATTVQSSIADAKSDLMRLKTDAPYLFPSFLRLRAAENALRVARKEYDDAKSEWDNLGK